MSMRRCFALLVLLVAAACGNASTPDGLRAVPTPTVSADPMSLVGMWKVDGADDVVLRFGDEVTLFRDCGGINADWRASHDGGLVLYSSSGDMACYPDNHDSTPEWFDRVQGFRVAGADRTLVDGEGRVVVTLQPGGRPRPGTNRAPEAYREPTPSPRLAARMAAPAPLPGGLVPVTYATLTGHRWLAPDNPRGYVEYATDGSWRASDGCNGEGGRFALGQDGLVLTVSGGSTLIGCQNSALPQWVQSAGRLGLDGSQLVLVDAQGNELGRAASA